jgi:phosphoribosylamine--glycine ligase
MKEVFVPTIEAMNKKRRKFKGVLYFGLMLTKDGPKVLEYNARFGDPETQVVLPRLKTDLLDIFEAIIDEKLADVKIEWNDNAAVCVVAASGGYPGKYTTGIEINGLDEAEANGDTVVFHAGTSFKEDKFYTSGGRVLGVTALEDTMDKAIAKAYAGIEKISFEGMHYRKDIGRK